MSDKREGVVSVCATCRFAEWKQTANGRRHPDGTGRCTFQFPDSPLPKWALNGWGTGRATTAGEVLAQHCGARYIYWRGPQPCATHEAIA